VSSECSGYCLDIVKEGQKILYIENTSGMLNGGSASAQDLWTFSNPAGALPGLQASANPKSKAKDFSFSLRCYFRQKRRMYVFRGTYITTSKAACSNTEFEVGRG